MALEVITLKAEVDASQLELFNQLLDENAKKAGLSEREVKELTSSIQKQVGAVRRVQSEFNKEQAALRNLQRQLRATNDAGSQDKLQAEIKQTEDRIEALRADARGLGVDLERAGRQGAAGLGRTQRAARQTGGALPTAGAGGINLQGFAGGLLGGIVAGGAAGLLSGAVSSIRSLQEETLQLFDIQEKADAQLKAAIISTNGAVGRSFDDLKNQAAELQGQTLFGDEEIQGAQSILLTFRNVREEVFDRTTPAILDVATALGTDLQSASLQIGKALNDPVRGLDGLSRSGIQFSESQKEVIRDLVATGEVAQAQTLILEELETQFSGSAQAAAQAGTGGIKQLENQISDLKEEIGEQFIPTQEAATRLQLAFFTALNESFQSGLIRSIFDFFGDLSQRLDEVSALFNQTTDATNETGDSFSILGTAVDFLIAPFRLVGSAVEGVLIRFRQGVQIFNAITAAIREVGTQINILQNDIRQFSFGNFFESIAQAFGRSIEADNLAIAAVDAVRNIESAINSVDLSSDIETDQLNEQIVDALQKGLITNEQADAFSAQLQTRIDQALRVSRRDSTVPLNVSVKEDEKAAEKANQAIEKQEELIQKEIQSADRIIQQAQKLQLSIEVEQAGGADSLAGLQILEDAEIEQAEQRIQTLISNAQTEIQDLRLIQSSDIASETEIRQAETRINELFAFTLNQQEILEVERNRISQEFAERRATAENRIAQENAENVVRAESLAFEQRSEILERQLTVIDTNLAKRVLSEQLTQAEIIELEKQAAEEKRNVLEKFINDNIQQIQRLNNENELRISELIQLPDSELVRAELEERLGLQKQYASEVQALYGQLSQSLERLDTPDFEFGQIQGIDGIIEVTNVISSIQTESGNSLDSFLSAANATTQTLNTIFERTAQTRINNIQSETATEIDRLQQVVNATEEGTDARANAERRLALAVEARDKRIAEIERQSFLRQQGAALAQTAINGAIAIAKAFAELGPIAGAIAAALVGTQIALQASEIRRASFPSFYKGTPYVARGNNPKGRDTIPAFLNEGERVISTKDNKAGWPIYEALRTGAISYESANTFVELAKGGIMPASMPVIETNLIRPSNQIQEKSVLSDADLKRLAKYISKGMDSSASQYEAKINHWDYRNQS